MLFQNSAKPAGIDIKVVREANDGYWSDVWMKKPFTAVYWSGRPVQDQVFSTTYTCGAEWNDGFWCNKRFDELLTTARAELDEAKRQEQYYLLYVPCLSLVLTGKCYHIHNRNWVQYGGY